MKYMVVATVWCRVSEKQIKKVVGMFDEYMNAEIFCKAYNDHYSAHARVEEIATLMN